MGLPLPFLAGLLVLAGHGLLDWWLPADPSLLRVLLATPLLLVPWFLKERRSRFAAHAVPFAYAAYLAAADLPTVAAHLGSGLRALELLVLLGPLLALALPVARRRVGMTLLLGTTIFFIASLGDLAGFDPRLQAWLQATSLGTTLGLLAMVGVLCVVFPPLVAVFLPARSLDRSRVQELVARVADALGFSRKRVLVLRTGFREANAALVGLIRWPRYLLVSDGLVSLLRSEPEALAGVIAHEVGHARGNHPAWFMLLAAIVPICLLQPGAWLVQSGLPHLLIWGAVVLGGVAMLLGYRLLAHRFELEADRFSAEALGSATACIRALQRIGDVLPSGQRTRASLRHPSEEQRVQTLLACEVDPVELARFRQRGAWIRRGLVLLAVAAVLGSVLAHLHAWPLDRARYHYATGEFRRAVDLAADLPASAERDEFLAAARTALELAPDGGAWDRIGADLADRALQKCRQMLVPAASKATAASARPFARLACSSQAPSAQARTLLRLVEALLDDDAKGAEKLAAHLARLSG